MLTICFQPLASHMYQMNGDYLSTLLPKVWVWIPIVYGLGIKEEYDTIKLILELIRCNEYGWQICCDLKMVGILLGMKKGYSTYQCFLCLWQHYTDYEWPARVRYDSAANQSIIFTPLVAAEKVILPPLHIKLGLIRSFIIALDREGETFDELKKIFPNLSWGKIYKGEIHKIILIYAQF